MLEFRVARQGMPSFIQTNTTWDNKTAIAVRKARQQDAVIAENSGVPRQSFGVQFNNMFDNINNAKAGCRSCRGTF
ncbi:MAG: hypothetical protein ACR2M6_00030 [Vampirovibrionia bacterium]|jgi:hypothetical protein